MELYNWPRMSVSSGGSGNLTLVAISGYPTIADVVGIGVQFTFALSTNVFAPLELGLATMLDATTMQIDAVHETFSGGVFDNTSPAALSIPVGALVHTPATKQSLNALYAGISHNHTGVYEPADATILKDADIGVSVQAYSANLAEYAAVNPSAAGLAILDDADAAAQRVTLGLEIGVNVEAYDANLVKKNVANTFTAQQTPMNGALTDGATIDWNGNTNGQVVSVTLGGNRTMNAPTNIQQYALYILRVTQDATGSRTLAWNAAYKFGTTGAPTLTTTASKVDILSFLGGAGNTLEYIGSRLDAV